MLKAIADYAKAADLGIRDIQFEFNSSEIKDDETLPSNIPEKLKMLLCNLCTFLPKPPTTAKFI